MASIRVEKVGELIQNFLAVELQRLKDPRLELVTITEVDLTPDLKRAHVFWSKLSCGGGEEGVAYPDPKEIKTVDQALKSAKGRLRKTAGKALGLKFTPDFIFKYDKTGETAGRIDALLAQVKTAE